MFYKIYAAAQARVFRASPAAACWVATGDMNRLLENQAVINIGAAKRRHK
jgi:hypothetical protein